MFNYGINLDGVTSSGPRPRRLLQRTQGDGCLVSTRNMGMSNADATTSDDFRPYLLLPRAALPWIQAFVTKEPSFVSFPAMKLLFLFKGRSLRATLGWFSCQPYRKAGHYAPMRETCCWNHKSRWGGRGWTRIRAKRASSRSCWLKPVPSIMGTAREADHLHARLLHSLRLPSF